MLGRWTFGVYPGFSGVCPGFARAGFSVCPAFTCWNLGSSAGETASACWIGWTWVLSWMPLNNLGILLNPILLNPVVKAMFHRQGYPKEVNEVLGLGQLVPLKVGMVCLEACPDSNHLGGGLYLGDRGVFNLGVCACWDVRPGWQMRDLPGTAALRALRGWMSSGCWLASGCWLMSALRLPS